MVETITPVVYGGRVRWAAALAMHTLGAVVTAAAFGGLLGWLGAALGAPWGRAGAVMIVAAAGLYAVSELPRVKVAVPQLRRQVPDWWRSFFGWPAAAALYGAGLGIGFFTYLAHGTLVVVSVSAAATGRPAVGAVIVGVFGLARGLSAAAAVRVGSPDESRRLIDRLADAPDRRLAIANGVALLAVTVLAVGEAVRLDGGWVGLAGAATAGVFAWSAASKAFGVRRWRRTLAAHELPRVIERMATAATPVAEAAVPTLALLGWRRAAGVWALILLAVFTLEVLRVGMRVGRRVPCGCFGRGSLDLRAVLARNAVLAVPAAAVALLGSDAPIMTWPGSPGAGEILPMLLALAGLAVAGFTAWSAAVWLGRGRQA